MSDARTAEQLASALFTAPPREARILADRLLHGRTRAEAAALWGVGPDAADLMLLRAARAFEAALAQRPAAAPPEFGLEATLARELAGALEGRPASAPAEALAAPLRQVVAEKAAVQSRWQALVLEAEASPRRRLETWARRLAILAILALVAFFEWRSQHKEKQPVRYEPRPANRSR